MVFWKTVKFIVIMNETLLIIALIFLVYYYIDGVRVGCFSFCYIFYHGLTVMVELD